MTWAGACGKASLKPEQSCSREVCVKLRNRLLTLTTAVALGASLAIAPLTSYVAPAAASARSTQVNAKVFTEPLKVVGQVNLSQLPRG
jgi:hypothetical protein